MNRLLLLPMLILLIKCAKLKEGHVTEFHIEKERTYIHMQPIPHFNGKTTFCTYIPIKMHDDTDYIVNIKGLYKNDTIEERHYVSRDKYKKLKKGDYICLKKDCLQEPNKDKKIN